MAVDPQFEERLSQFIDQQFPGSSVGGVDQLTAGASQQTFRVRTRSRDGVQRDYALRRAQPGLVAGSQGQLSTSAEVALLRLAQSAGVPVPNVICELEPRHDMGEGYLMEWLEGETLGHRIVKLPELAEMRATLAYECGQTLAKIHALPVPHSLRRVLHCVSPEVLVRETWDAYIALNTPQPMIDFTAQWLLSHLPTTVTQCLVHGDFRNGNLMVSKTGIRAVLDWELCHMGDPMRDLGWLCVNSWRFGQRDLAVGGFGASSDLVLGYESVSGVSVDTASLLFWEVFGSFWWSITTLGMANTWRTGETPSVERPVIGRRSSEAQMDCARLLIPGSFETLQQSGSDANLPQTQELIGAVRGHLLDGVAPVFQGADKFLIRVAVNALAIAERELALGPDLISAEHFRLKGLFGEGDLDALRWRLVEMLRSGTHLPDDALTDHLRNTVAGQLQIDQPNYSALTQ